MRKKGSHYSNDENVPRQLKLVPRLLKLVPS